MRNSVHPQRMLEEARALLDAIGIAEGLAIGFEKGRLEEARKILLRSGERRFGLPDPGTLAAIESTDSIEKIEGWLDLAPDVSSWEEVLAQPTTEE